VGLQTDIKFERKVRGPGRYPGFFFMIRNKADYTTIPDYGITVPVRHQVSVNVKSYIIL